MNHLSVMQRCEHTVHTKHGGGQQGSFKHLSFPRLLLQITLIYEPLFLTHVSILIFSVKLTNIVY